MKVVVTESQQLYEDYHRLDGAYHTSDGVQALSFLRHWAKNTTKPVQLTLDIIQEKGVSYVTRKLDTLGEACGPDGIFVGKWLKRIYVNSPEHGAPYVTGSSIVQADPLIGAKYLSYRHGDYIDELALHNQMILMTCSGTIGNLVYINDNFKGAVGSPDLFRIVADPDRILPGYLYVFLSSKMGQALINKGVYGGVVQHIEIPYMKSLPIPRLNPATEQHIHNLIERAASLRVAAQRELNSLTKQLNEEILGIPKGYTTRWPNEWSYSVNVVHRSGSLRLDPFHFVGHAAEYQQYLKRGPQLREIAKVELPGQFKRMYVGPHGIPYLSGVDVYQFKVEPRLWLSPRQPELPELVVSEAHTILVQADGQRYGLLGRPVYVDEAITGAAFSNHLVRIHCHDVEMVGYVFLFLSTDAGRRELIRHSYGTSIPTIPAKTFEELRICSAETELARQMGQRAITALNKRTQANQLEDQTQVLLAEALGLKSGLLAPARRESVGVEV